MQTQPGRRKPTPALRSPHNLTAPPHNAHPTRGTAAAAPQVDWSFPSSHATIAAVIVVAWRRWRRGGCRSGRTPVADTTARIAPTTRPTRSTATGALAQIRPPPAIRAVRLCRASTRPCRLEALTGQTPPWLLQIRLCGREGLVRCVSTREGRGCSGTRADVTCDSLRPVRGAVDGLPCRSSVLV